MYKRVAMVMAAILVLPLLPVTGASAARDDEIVYAARYYTPPGRKSGRSYFHLYRVNPDGTGRRQITFDPWNESEPRWSPDGRRILFLRTHDTSEGYAAGEWRVCVINAGGGPPRTLRTVRASSITARWSSNGRAVICSEPAGNEDGVREYAIDGRNGMVRTARHEPLVNAGNAMDDVRLEPETTGRWTLVFTGSGGEERRKLLRFPPAKNGAEISLRTYVTPLPGDAARYLLGTSMEGNSTWGHWSRYWSIDTKTGEVTPFTEGERLAWSPGGAWFATVVGRSLAPYGNALDGRTRQVWVSPLLVGSGKTGRTRPIVSGLVWVTDADWRPSRQKR